MNRSLVKVPFYALWLVVGLGRLLATLFVCSSSFARRDRSLFANLHGKILRISKYSFVLDHKVEIPDLYSSQSSSPRLSLTRFITDNYHIISSLVN